MPLFYRGTKVASCYLCAPLTNIPFTPTPTSDHLLLIPPCSM